MAYTTPDEVKAYLGGFDDASAADDAFLLDLCTKVKAAIDRHCHRTFEAAADTTVYFDAVKNIGFGDWSSYGRVHSLADAQERRTLYFEDVEFCQITSVVNGDGETIPSTEYIELPQRHLPWFALRLKHNSSYAWTWDETPEEAIAITGRAAYSITRPDDLALQARRLVAYAYKQRENYDANVERPVVSPDGFLRLPTTWPPDVLAGLLPFRRL